MCVITIANAPSFLSAGACQQPKRQEQVEPVERGEGAL